MQNYSMKTKHRVRRDAHAGRTTLPSQDGDRCNANCDRYLEHNLSMSELYLSPISRYVLLQHSYECEGFQEQIKTVYKKLIEKLIIVSTGAKKRGNQEAFQKYDQKLKQCLIKLEEIKYESK